MTAAVLLGGAAVFLQLAAFMAVASQTAPPSGLLEPVLLHASASVLFALAVRRLHARSHPQQARRFALFVGVANAFLPMVGPLAWLLAVRPCIRAPGALARRTTDPQPYAPASAEPSASLQPSPQLGPAREIWGVLRHSTSARSRVEALTATLTLDHASAGEVLRFAVRDAEDDVRLLAFALLTQRELALTRRIGAGRNAGTASGAAPPRASADKAAAHACWQLALLAGRGSPGATPLCRRALQHTRRALAQAECDAGLHLLASRLHLELGELVEAAASVAAAQRAGAASEQCERLCAEVQFHTHRLRQEARA